MPAFRFNIVIALLLLASPVVAAELDTDGDGLSDTHEQSISATDPLVDDTDGDGFLDGDEIAHGFSPRHTDRKKLTDVDSDTDGLPDAWEMALGSNLLVRDTDGDGHLDGTEVHHGYSPTDPTPQKVEKRIAVDVPRFTLSYFHDNKKLDTILVSTGRKGYPTPRGTFHILAKVPSKHYGGPGFTYSYPNTKWNLQFTTAKDGHGQWWRYYIHGAYWHNEFGKKNKSAGCVNVAYADMERLYTWADTETTVVVR